MLELSSVRLTFLFMSEMEDISEELDAGGVELPEDDGIDWAYGQGLARTTDAQTLAVRYYIALGCRNKAAAIRLAGYGGSGASQRSHASQVFNQSEAVKTLLAWALTQGAQGLEDQCDLASVKKRMAYLMNASSGPAAVQAGRFLRELLELEEMERSNHRDTSPLDTLRSISAISPLLALAIARRDGVGWDLPATDLPKALQELRALSEIVQTATARANPAAPPNANGSAHMEASNG